MFQIERTYRSGQRSVKSFRMYKRKIIQYAAFCIDCHVITYHSDSMTRSGALEIYEVVSPFRVLLHEVVWYQVMYNRNHRMDHRTRVIHSPKMVSECQTLVIGGFCSGVRDYSGMATKPHSSRLNLSQRLNSMSFWDLKYFTRNLFLAKVKNFFKLLSNQ